MQGWFHQQAGRIWKTFGFHNMTDSAGFVMFAVPFFAFNLCIHISCSFCNYLPVLFVWWTREKKEQVLSPSSNMVSSYIWLYRFISPKVIRSPLGTKASKIIVVLGAFICKKSVFAVAFTVQAFLVPQKQILFFINLIDPNCLIVHHFLRISV